MFTIQNRRFIAVFAIVLILGICAPALSAQSGPAPHGPTVDTFEESTPSAFVATFQALWNQLIKFFARRGVDLDPEGLVRGGG